MCLSMNPFLFLEKPFFEEKGSKRKRLRLVRVSARAASRCSCRSSVSVASRALDARTSSRNLDQHTRSSSPKTRIEEERLGTRLAKRSARYRTQAARDDATLRTAGSVSKKSSKATPPVSPSSSSNSRTSLRGARQKKRSRERERERERHTHTHQREGKKNRLRFSWREKTTNCEDSDPPVLEWEEVFNSL